MTVPLERRQAAKRALALPEEALLAECEVDVFAAGGPGGQHRNKTESGVRLTHPPTELSVTATERRSQGQNKRVALERLREGLAQLSFVPKVRRKTHPTRGSKERRLKEKRVASERKSNRTRDFD